MLRLYREIFDQGAFQHDKSSHIVDTLVVVADDSAKADGGRNDETDESAKIGSR